MAAVMSEPKIACSMPATALASRVSDVGVEVGIVGCHLQAPEGPKRSVLTRDGDMPKRDQVFGGGLDERSGSADVGHRLGGRPVEGRGEHLPVDAAATAGPARRLAACQRLDHAQAVVVRGQRVDLLAIDDVVEGA